MCKFFSLSALLIGLLFLFKPLNGLSWQFAVTTDKSMLFFDENWKYLKTVTNIWFENLSAFEYNEIADILIFNDRDHNQSTLFSLKLYNNSDVQRAQELALKSSDEYVQGIAYDSYDNTIYWTDSVNRMIYKLSLDSIDKKPELFYNCGAKTPHGIDIDVCRRTLYWTNRDLSSPSIEMIHLENNNNVSKTIIDATSKKVERAFGIKVDQDSKRLYWVDDLQGSAIQVGSSNLDGSDIQILYRGSNQQPTNLVVVNGNIYWTDAISRSIWMLDSNEANKTIKSVMTIKNNHEYPKGVVQKSSILKQKNNPSCKNLLQKLYKEKMNDNTTEVLESKSNSTNEFVMKITDPLNCYNKGLLNLATNECECSNRFKGKFCEIDLCTNFCLNDGICVSSSTGVMKCECTKSYTGKRCELNKCPKDYCLNNISCTLDLQTDKGVCICSKYFTGARCETLNMKEICDRHRNSIDNSNLNLNINFDLSIYCGEGNNNTMLYNSNNEITRYERNRAYNCSLSIYAEIGAWLTASLVLLVIITLLIYRIYKPKRPKVKKTFVFRKNITPLTCRPSAEQCEVTIEDCCNLNICDTPCFDPKMLEGYSNGDNRKVKEDKKTLLNEMECNGGELY